MNESEGRERRGCWRRRSCLCRKSRRLSLTPGHRREGRGSAAGLQLDSRYRERQIMIMRRRRAGKLLLVSVTADTCSSEIMMIKRAKLIKKGNTPPTRTMDDDTINHKDRNAGAAGEMGETAETAETGETGEREKMSFYRRALPLLCFLISLLLCFSASRSLLSTQIDLSLEMTPAGVITVNAERGQCVRDE